MPELASQGRLQYLAQALSLPDDDVQFLALSLLEECLLKQAYK
jgi:hypothetical protein